MNEGLTPTCLTGHAKKSVISLRRDMVLAIAPTLLMGLSAVTGRVAFCYCALLFLPFGLIYPTSLIPVLMVTSLSSNFFAAAEGIGSARLFAVTIVLGVLISMIRIRRKVNLFWLRLIILITISTLLAAATNGAVSMSAFSTVGLNLLIAFAFSNIRLTSKEFERTLFCVFAAFSLITVLILLDLSVAGIQELTLGRVSLDSDLNTNRQAMMSAQLGAFLFGYAVYFPKKGLKILSALLGLVNFFVCLISGSRTGCLAVILGVAVSLLVFSRINKKDLKGIAAAVLIAAIGVLIFQFVVGNNATLAQRYSLIGITESGGSGRLERMVCEIKYIIPKHPLFGVGPSSIYETLALTPFLKRPGSSHNIIISMLTQLGIVGGAVYIAVFSSAIKRLIASLRRLRFALIPLSMLLTGLFNGIGEVMYCERLLWIAVAFSILCINSSLEADEAAPEEEPVPKDGRYLCRKYR